MYGRQLTGTFLINSIYSECHAVIIIMGGICGQFTCTFHRYMLLDYFNWSLSRSVYIQCEWAIMRGVAFY